MKKSTVEVGSNWVEIEEDGTRYEMIYDKESDMVGIFVDGEERVMLRGWYLRRFGWECRGMKNE